MKVRCMDGTTDIQIKLDISGRMTYMRKQDISDKTRDIHADKMRYLR